MSELRFEDYAMPAADLGGENPLPPLATPPVKSAPKASPHETLSAEERKYFGYGTAGILPHCLQDGYNRDRRPRSFLAAVLENQTLRATFIPQLGGRLWSLIHKPSERELLCANPVFQPANLAFRNAWFSGGVEWNMGVIGHNPQTCSPLFAAKATGPHGEPALRMYEWDRTRCAPYQIDACLPDGSTMLYVRVGLANPHDETIPMYWWSNIAVNERPDVRVIAPARQAISHGYRHGLGKVPVPVSEGVDETYATNSRASRDWFYCIPAARRKWIAALDGDGRGLAQVSTDLLRGRKLFAWGMGDGGRHWQEFLSVPGQAYIEIQAGLCPTQMECVPMPAGARWSWLEAYGLMEADASVVHGSDWDAACDHVESHFERQLPRRRMQEELALADRAAALPPAEIVMNGSGWGALERRRRSRAGLAPFAGDAIRFTDESLAAVQKPWLSLLESGQLPPATPQDQPPSYMVQSEWRDMLAASLTGSGDHWLARLHMGVMLYHDGRYQQAKEAWEQSIRMTPSAWAYRNLAVAAKHDSRLKDAAGLYASAAKLLPNLLPLAVECITTMLDAGQAAEALTIIGQLPPDLASHGRIRLLKAKAAIDADRPELAIEILQADLVVPEIREGERSLSDLWFAAQQKRLARELNVPISDELGKRVRRECPPPRHLDFRMTADG